MKTIGVILSMLFVFVANARTQVNIVDSNVEDYHNLVGPGNHVIHKGGGLQAVYFNGIPSPRILRWSGSTNNGTNWNPAGAIGLALPDDDTAPAIAVNSNGTYVAYLESGSSSQVFLLFNNNPFSQPDSFSVAATLTPPGSWAGVSLSATTNGVAWASYDFVSEEIVVGISLDGSTFPPATPVYTGSIGIYPTIVVEGSYVLVAFLTSDSGLVPTDTAITNHAGGEWLVFTESTDGGSTWSAVAPMFGFNIGDFPIAEANLEGTMGTVAAAGGTSYLNIHQPLIRSGTVFVPTSNSAVTLNDGTYSYGYWDRLLVSGLSYKPAAGGGSWIHEALSGVERISGEVRGDTWYPQVSVLEPGTCVFLTYNDQATDPNEIHMQSTELLGGYWLDQVWNADFDLGIPGPGNTVFFSASPDAFSFFGFGSVDIIYVGENGGVYNNTLYHTVLASGIDLSVEDPDSPFPSAVHLESNYPNPFNPSTTIRFHLNDDGPVLLTVFNALGEKVQTLLNQSMTPGEHKVTFDGTGLASGVYFYSLAFEGQTRTGKMLLVK